jgi:isoaspartyl peptidase/L-asparaginase-like protein (Ntn-hydrolase superfamily)
MPPARDRSTPARRHLPALIVHGGAAADPDYAVRVAVDLLVEQGRGEGGLILLDAKGRMGDAQSTPFMPVGWRGPSSHEPQVPF